MKNESSYRIELLERYIANVDQLEYLEELGVDVEKNKEYKYRRTYILFDQIDRPIEIPGNKHECIIRLWTGEDICIKGSYDDICIKFNDIDNNYENGLQ